MTIICIMVSCMTRAGNNETSIPDISGNIRVRYDYSTVYNAGRFAVNNARIKLDGKIMPRVGYRVQIDMCNNGKIRLMDAYAKLSPSKKLDIFLGQERVPFSVDASRDLHEYLFSDLSFGAHYLGNLRSVGLKAGYRFFNDNAYIEGGFFNSGTAENQGDLRGGFTYSAKMNLHTAIGLFPQICFMSRKPFNGMRHNMTGISLSWNHGAFFIEGEYIHCNYTGKDIPDAHAFNLMVDYIINVNKGILSEVSFRGRLDGMTDMSSGIPDDNGKIDLDFHHRKRATAGIRLSSSHRHANLALQLDYHHYLNGSPSGTDASDNDRLVAMLVLHF